MSNGTNNIIVLQMSVIYIIGFLTILLRAIQYVCMHDDPAVLNWMCNTINVHKKQERANIEPCGTPETTGSGWTDCQSIPQFYWQSNLPAETHPLWHHNHLFCIMIVTSTVRILIEYILHSMHVPIMQLITCLANHNNIMRNFLVFAMRACLCNKSCVSTAHIPYISVMCIICNTLITL